MAMVPPHCPPGTVDGPLLCAMFPHTHEPGVRHIRGTRNVGYTFIERNREAARRIDNAFPWWDWIAAGSSWSERCLREAGFTCCSAVPQGVDHALFHPADGERESVGLTVFSGGCFRYRKGQDVVIAAMRVMMARHADVRLAAAWETAAPQQDFASTMAASGLIDYQGGTLAEVCARNGLDMARVRLFPAMPHAEMAGLYHASDVGLFPNRCEGGTNLVLMEYMACGKAAIATTGTGHADILTAGNCLPAEARPLHVEEDGVPVAEWVEPELEHVVERLEEAYRNRAVLRDAGREAARDMLAWTWERTARGLLAALEAG